MGLGSLEGDESAALDLIGSGGNFAGMCELLCDWHEPEEVPALAMTMLKRWLDEGLISELRPTA